MIRSKYFWIGIVSLAIIPLLLIDIGEHRVEWEKEVWNETIYLVHSMYPYDKQQKGVILDRVFERNKTLMFLMYIKAFLGIILLVLSVYFFRLYRKQPSPLWKAVVTGAAVMAVFMAAKLMAAQINTNRHIQIIQMDADEQSIQKLLKKNFGGKVVYLDFWGTTCGPCIEQFMNFTRPLKNKYKSRDDISYLYIGRGSSYLWKKQIQKYDVQGYHIFLGDNRYDELYRQVKQDPAAQVLMPTYMIADKKGNIVVSNAQGPDKSDSLSMQLDKYLAQHP